jgi:hypothetical protein
MKSDVFVTLLDEAYAPQQLQRVGNGKIFLQFAG